jgi:hypothetical protein
MHSFSAEWQPTSMAPSDRDLEICVLDYDGIVHTFPLACHKDGPNWVDARGKRHSISSRPIGATGVNSTKQGSVGRPTDAPWNAVSAFANCGRAVAHFWGSYVPISSRSNLGYVPTFHNVS